MPNSQASWQRQRLRMKLTSTGPGKVLAEGVLDDAPSSETPPPLRAKDLLKKLYWNLQVTISPDDPRLRRYRHAVPRLEAERLLQTIQTLEAAGLHVESAVSARSAVPHAYRYTSRMHAPYYLFNRHARTIKLVDGHLMARPYGRPVRATYCVTGKGTVPPGFRIYRRYPFGYVLKAS